MLSATHAMLSGAAATTEVINLRGPLASQHTHSHEPGPAEAFDHMLKNMYLPSRDPHTHTHTQPHRNAHLQKQTQHAR